MIGMLLRGASNTCFVIGGLIAFVSVSLAMEGVPAELTQGGDNAAFANGAAAGYLVGIFLPTIALVMAGWGLRAVAKKCPAAATLA